MTELYKGDNFRQFLIDRYAMGFNFFVIASEFESIHGIPLNKKDAKKILEESEEEIIQREIELKKVYSDRSVLGQIMEIKGRLLNALDLVEDEGDFRTFASISNTLIKSIEFLAKSVELLESRQDKRGSVAKTDNYLALEHLEKEGIIEIKQKDKLKGLLGVEIDG